MTALRRQDRAAKAMCRPKRNEPLRSEVQRELLEGGERLLKRYGVEMHSGSAEMR
jgi:hypothetical protein